MMKAFWTGLILIRYRIWRGDKIFLKLIAEKVPFFSLKLVYDGHDGLVSAVLNGTELDLEKA